MLPNHSPLVIAEQFGTLESLYPGPDRSGPGPRAGHRRGDHVGAAPRRRERRRTVFRRTCSELLAYFEPAVPGQRVHAVPGEGLRVPVWLLGPACSAPSWPRCSGCRSRSRRTSRRTTCWPRSTSTGAISAVRRPRAAVRHCDAQRRRRRQRRRGCSPVHVAAAAVRPAATRHARQASAADRSGRRALVARRGADDRAHAALRRRRRAATVRRVSTTSSRRPAPTRSW